MTGESDLFCMLLLACREMAGCSRLRSEMIVRMKKIFNSVFLLFRRPEMCYHTQ